ncbi:hypothetical protein [Nocardia wallacei]|uniref:hypothetical protein n=1 Tax=Nocardia wallacei TaxID=480035 RepID=UPI0024580C2A|nr:hypothetical protein [Nocardia wallacei]
MPDPRPNTGPPSPPLTDERLRQLAYDPIVASNANEVAMAIELLKLRDYAANHEGRCNNLCPRCGTEVGIPLDRYREALESIASERDPVRHSNRFCWEMWPDYPARWCHPCVAQYALDPWTGREQA